VGARLRRRRRDLDLTQAALAGAEYTKSFISQLESGYAEPSLDTLRFLTRRLHLGLSTVAGDATDQRLAAAAGLLAWVRERAGANDDLARAAVAIARELAREARSAHHELDAALALAELEIAAGRLPAAAAAVQDAADLAGPLGRRARMRADLAAGWLALRRGEPADARAAFRRALGHVRKASRHADLAARALLGLGAAALDAGDAQQARRRLESAVSTARRARDPGVASRGLVRLAWLAARERRVEDSAARLAEAAALVDGDTDPQARAEVARVRAFLEQGVRADAGEGAEPPPWPLDALALV
jgi:transcriptional regulator with XRE-family HTH domain